MSAILLRVHTLYAPYFHLPSLLITPSDTVPPAESAEAPPIRRECRENLSGFHPDSVTISLSACVAWLYLPCYDVNLSTVRCEGCVFGQHGVTRHQFHHKRHGRSVRSQLLTAPPTPSFVFKHMCYVSVLGPLFDPET